MKAIAAAFEAAALQARAVDQEVASQTAAGTPCQLWLRLSAGTSSYKDDFKPFPIQQPPPFQPPQYQGTGAKFEGTTETMDK